MPIRKELRHFYRGKEWQDTRKRILARAGDKCEHCGAPNNTSVLRAFAWWTPATIQSTVFWAGGRLQGEQVTTLPWHHKDILRVAHFPKHGGMHWSGIQLGIAHINHDPSDQRDENLAALCRRCHLIHDIGHHRLTRSTRKDKARPLLPDEAIRVTRSSFRSGSRTEPAAPASTRES